MTKKEYEMLCRKSKAFLYHSFSFLSYEIVKTAHIIWQDEDCIVCRYWDDSVGYEKIHWMANSFEALWEVVKVQNDPVLISFVPLSWKEKLLSNGCEEYAQFHDFWKTMTKKDTNDDVLSYLKEGDEAKASALTMRCAGISRGFTGESEAFFRNWKRGSEASLLEVHAQSSDILCMYDQEVLCGIALTAVYGKEDRKTVWLRLIAVDPDLQRRGIGRSLMRQVLAYGVKHQVKKAFLAADICNTHAIHLYEKNGFQLDEDDGELTLLYHGTH